MVRQLRLSLFALALCLAVIGEGRACSVGVIGFEKAFSTADVVVSAHVVSVDVDPPSIENDNIANASDLYILAEGNQATLAVTEVWKGKASKQEFLRYTDDTAACGFALNVGQDVVLLARRIDDRTLVASRHGVGGIGVVPSDRSLLERYGGQPRTPD